jgi:hypothetical protein
MKTGIASVALLPRLLRFRDAPTYLGMDRNRFNAEVRPFLTNIPIGRQGIAFDRLELDAWVDDYVSCNGRPGLPKGDSIWDAKERQGSLREKGSGISTSALVGNAFAKALERLNRKKPNSSSQGKSKKLVRRKSTAFGRRDRSKLQV